MPEPKTPNPQIELVARALALQLCKGHRGASAASEQHWTLTEEEWVGANWESFIPQATALLVATNPINPLYQALSARLSMARAYVGRVEIPEGARKDLQDIFFGWQPGTGRTKGIKA